MFKEIYELIKQLVSAAKKIHNQQVISLALELQEKFFDLRENNEKLNDEIKQLNEQITLLNESPNIEDNINYRHRGFFTIKTDKVEIPYCSACWKTTHQLVPLAQKGSWFQFHCSKCNSDIVVTTDDGKQFGKNH